ncbi:hypothetical protein [Actinoplanes sp. URMC 104]|uniref:hypothetical protein n=1 Tax=Actinoplanes sp. URMC 104 TaxID=3423409 RepID=UPI003F1A61B3
MPGRRYNCSCGKKRYRDESSALAAADEDAAAYGESVTVYRCPGGLAWHLTTRGFTPEALRSTGRRLAYALLSSNEVDLDGFDPRRRRRALECAAQMSGLGLVLAADGVVRAVDRAGLARVVQVGLDAYAEEASGQATGSA